MVKQEEDRLRRAVEVSMNPSQLRLEEDVAAGMGEQAEILEQKKNYKLAHESRAMADDAGIVASLAKKLIEMRSKK